MHVGSDVKKFRKNENKEVRMVVLENGEKIEADVVIYGAGAKPVTDFMKDGNF